jgi:hypothetical protein
MFNRFVWCGRSLFFPLSASYSAIKTVSSDFELLSFVHQTKSDFSCFFVDTL